MSVSRRGSYAYYFHEEGKGMCGSFMSEGEACKILSMGEGVTCTSFHEWGRDIYVSFMRERHVLPFMGEGETHVFFSWVRERHVCFFHEGETCTSFHGCGKDMCFLSWMRKKHALPFVSHMSETRGLSTPFYTPVVLARLVYFVRCEMRPSDSTLAVNLQSICLSYVAAMCVLDKRFHIHKKKKKKKHVWPACSSRALCVGSKGDARPWLVSGSRRGSCPWSKAIVLTGSLRAQDFARRTCIACEFLLFFPYSARMADSDWGLVILRSWICALKTWSTRWLWNHFFHIKSSSVFLKHFGIVNPGRVLIYYQNLLLQSSSVRIK